MTEFFLFSPLEGTTRLTQGFGWRPDYYKQFGLPGHEGVDLVGSGPHTLAAFDGVVTEVGWHNGNINHPYGYNVRIVHDMGNGLVYRTIYAHGKPGTEQVGVGDAVKNGQPLIQWDSTGNVQGAHLHLSLTRDGATAAKVTTWPFDIIDPTPFLVPRLVSPVFAFPCPMRIIAHDGLRVRSGPGVTFAKIKTLPYGEVVEVVKTLTDVGGAAWGKIASDEQWIMLAYAQAVTTTP